MRAIPPGVSSFDLAAVFAAAGDGPVIVALSGGGDSTALLHLLAPLGDVRAVIVDHALRPESAAEAEQTAARAAALGVAAQIVRLKWRYEEKHTQAVMRAKRYEALCDAARAAGARVVALGHTLDDQAETLILRAEAGSRWRGLAGMAPLAPAPIWPHGRRVLVARPLLGARRTDLRVWLRQRRIAWIDDPSNENDSYARIRVRRALAADRRRDPVRLARLAALHRRRAQREDAAAAAWLARVLRAEEGVAWLDLGAAAAPAHVRRRALAAVLTAVSGAQRPPAAAPLGRLQHELEAPGFAGATLHGCRLELRRGLIRIGRDPGAAYGRGGRPGVARLSVFGRDRVFDGRAEILGWRRPWYVTVDPTDPDQIVIDNPDGGRPQPPVWLLRERLSDILFTPP